MRRRALRVELRLHIALPNVQRHADAASHARGTLQSGTHVRVGRRARALHRVHHVMNVDEHGDLDHARRAHFGSFYFPGGRLIADQIALSSTATMDNSLPHFAGIGGRRCLRHPSGMQHGSKIAVESLHALHERLHGVGAIVRRIPNSIV